MNVLEKIITTIVTGIIVSFTLALHQYIPLAEQEVGVAYWTFIDLLTIFNYYLLPVFLLGGVLFALLADVVLEKVNGRRSHYFAGLGIYGIGGVILNVYLLIILVNGGLNKGSLEIILLGVVSSWVFFHLSLVVRNVLDRYV